MLGVLVKYPISFQFLLCGGKTPPKLLSWDIDLSICFESGAEECLCTTRRLSEMNKIPLLCSCRSSFCSWDTCTVTASGNVGEQSAV